MRLRIFKFLAFQFLLFLPVFAEENCIYITKEGLIKSSNSKAQIPDQYQAIAKCQIMEKGNFLAKPEEIDLGNTTRREEINSPLGQISLRWPRTAESLFGRTPVRAMADAAKTVSKVIRSSSFPTEVQNMNLNWNVVFMDENLPENQIPTNLISNCHPGWMTPPANIYIVAQRVAAGCGGNAVTPSFADKKLTEVLVHEMGHALEFFMLSANNNLDKMRAEGFATWFEMHASQYSSLMDKRELTQRTAQMAALAIRNSPNIFTFSGSGEDYARAAMYFASIEDRFGLRGIISIYDAMNKQGLDLFQATEHKYSINRNQIEKEAIKFIEKND